MARQRCRLRALPRADRYADCAADVAWSEGGGPASPLPVPKRPLVAPEAVQTAVRILRSGEPAMLLLSGQVLSEAGLVAAQRIAHATGAMLRTPTQVHRMARGRGRPPVDRIPYLVDVALKALGSLKHMILVARGLRSDSSRILESQVSWFRRTVRCMCWRGQSKTVWRAGVARW